MAAMTPIDDFIPLVTRHAQGFNDLAMISALRDAARLLCESADIWRDKASFELTAPDGQELDLIDDAEIERIDAAFLNDVKLEPATIQMLDDKYPLWRVDAEDAGYSRYVTQLMPGTIAVYPLSTGVMMASFILKPSYGADNLPAILAEKYPLELGRGAAGILMTGQATDNPQLGLDHRAYFEGRLGTLKMKNFRNQTGGRMRTKPHWL